MHIFHMNKLHHMYIDQNNLNIVYMHYSVIYSALWFFKNVIVWLLWRHFLDQSLMFLASAAFLNNCIRKSHEMILIFNFLSIYDVLNIVTGSWNETYSIFLAFMSSKNHDFCLKLQKSVTFGPYSRKRKAVDFKCLLKMKSSCKPLEQTTF